MTKRQFRQTRAEISKSHLIANLRALKGLQEPGEFLCPMVKCDAYGHGALRVSKWLIEEKVDALGVALVEEGLKLRQNGLSEGRILIFGILPEAAAPSLLENGLTPVVSTVEELQFLARSSRGKSNFSIHLKIDTGMHRLGFSWSHLARVRKILGENTSLKVEGICTHLACAEDVGREGSMSARQIDLFRKAEGQLGLSGITKHVLNSTALVGRQFLSAQERKSWTGLGARPGISLYGCFDDFECLDEAGREWVDLNLNPVMRLVAELVMIKGLEAGQSVSYGATWTARKPTTVGIAAFGYGDGYPRRLSNVGTVLYKGRLVPVIGRVCMDYTLLDLSEMDLDSSPQAGDEVIFFGDEEKRLSAVDLAQSAGTISYEVFTGISERVPRLEV
ncbi:MAG: alanine racemase [Bdellovibrionales bacterium]|nr:alanine racemase [Bdellovibrionales bacterium]